MEKIKMTPEIIDSYFGKILIDGLTMKKNTAIMKIFESHKNNEPFEIQLTIEGIELPIRKVFKDIEKQDNKRINKGVEKVIAKLLTKNCLKCSKA